MKIVIYYFLALRRFPALAAGSFTGESIVPARPRGMQRAVRPPKLTSLGRRITMGFRFGSTSGLESSREQHRHHRQVPAPRRQAHRRAARHVARPAEKKGL